MDVETLKIVVGLLNGVSENVFWAVVIWITLDFLNNVIGVFIFGFVMFKIVMGFYDTYKKTSGAASFTRDVFAMVGEDPYHWDESNVRSWVLEKLRKRLLKGEENG